MNSHTRMEYDFNKEVESIDNPHMYGLQVTEKTKNRKSMDTHPINNYGHRLLQCFMAAGI